MACAHTEQHIYIRHVILYGGMVFVGGFGGEVADTKQKVYGAL